MNIEFFTELNYDDQTATILTIDIDENSSIEELLSKIHEVTEIPVSIVLTWDGNIEEVSCSYYFKSRPEFESFRPIQNLKRKINDFPKNGANKELSLCIDTSIGYAN